MYSKQLHRAWGDSGGGGVVGSEYFNLTWPYSNNVDDQIEERARSSEKGRQRRDWFPSDRRRRNTNILSRVDKRPTAAGRFSERRLRLRPLRDTSSDGFGRPLAMGRTARERAWAMRGRALRIFRERLSRESAWNPIPIQSGLAQW